MENSLKKREDIQKNYYFNKVIGHKLCYRNMCQINTREKNNGINEKGNLNTIFITRCEGL